MYNKCILFYLISILIYIFIKVIGSLNIQVTVKDPYGATTYDTFNLYTYENQAPSITSVSSGTIAENSLRVNVAIA